MPRPHSLLQLHQIGKLVVINLAIPVFVDVLDHLLQLFSSQTEINHTQLLDI